MTEESPSGIRRFLDDFRVYADRRLVFVFLMGFGSGLPLLLTGATLSIWLTEIGIGLTTVGLFALAGTPYTLKFIWAPIVDRVKIPYLSDRLGRRRSWMLVFQLALLFSIAGLALSNPESTPEVTAVFALAVAFFSASQDIVIDAYRIEILDADQQGAGAAMTQAGYRTGLITAGAGALYLASATDWSITYGIMSALVILAIIVTLRSPLPAIEAVGSKATAELNWFRSALIDPFAEFINRSNPKTAFTILLFVMLYKFGDSFLGVMANPFYIKIGFTKIEIANVSKIFGIAAFVSGVFIGGIFVKTLGVLRSLVLGGILQMLSNLMFAAQAAVGPKISFLFLTIGIENVCGGIGSSAFVAYLSLLCNTSYTGTQFALFTSLMAVGRTWLSALSGWVADHTDWVSFFIISTFMALPGLALLVWMIRNLPLEVQTGRENPN